MWLAQNELTPERRRLYWWLVQSNGTTPAQFETGGRPQWSLNGSAFTPATNVLSAVSATFGRYYQDLTASETSQAGVMMFRYSSGTCFEQGPEGGPVQILPNSPYNPQYLSQQSRFQSGSTSTGALGSGETTADGFYSGAGILVEYGNGERQFNVISTYTGSSRIATFFNPMQRGLSSTISYWLIPGTTGTVPSTATVAQQVWEFSGRTVDYVSVVSIALSALTVESVIQLESFGAQLEEDVPRSILSFDVGNGRIVQEYLWPLRNKVVSDRTSSIITVYKPDDVTSSWTASTTTASIAISGFDPN